MVGFGADFGEQRSGESGVCGCAYAHADAVSQNAVTLMTRRFGSGKCALASVCPEQFCLRWRSCMIAAVAIVVAIRRAGALLQDRILRDGWCVGALTYNFAFDGREQIAPTRTAVPMTDSVGAVRSQWRMDDASERALPMASEWRRRELCVPNGGVCGASAGCRRQRIPRTRNRQQRGAATETELRRRSK